MLSRSLSLPSHLATDTIRTYMDNTLLTEKSIHTDWEPILKYNDINPVSEMLISIMVKSIDHVSHKLAEVIDSGEDKMEDDMDFRLATDFVFQAVIENNIVRHIYTLHGSSAPVCDGVKAEVIK
ncbi:hypothetical protein J6590_082160 [Homalodisca vitripennis]|nr:hypothetical protein J6590_064387 [Homalodisca vitripennis]KAG8334816.1 hypothetical protein J6590_082160 [Homalodisca vitripennis]